MLKIINLLLVILGLGNAFYLINERFGARNLYMQLSQLQNKAEALSKEYTRLQLEDGTYSSDLAVQDYAEHNLGLVRPDKQHIVELK